MKTNLGFFKALPVLVTSIVVGIAITDVIGRLTKKESFIAQLETMKGMSEDQIINFASGFGLKAAILIFIVYLMISSLVVAWQGKSLARKLYEQGENHSIREVKGITCVGYGIGSDDPEFEKASELRDNYKDIVVESKDGAEKLVNGVLLNVCRSFDLAQNYHAAATTLSNERNSLEKYFSEFFSGTGFAKTSLPLIGFAGTIVGIMLAMSGLSDSMGGNTKGDLAGVVASLSVAFDTTLVALICTYIVKSGEKRFAGKTSASINRFTTGIELNVLGKLKAPSLTTRLEALVETIMHKREVIEAKNAADKIQREADEAQEKADAAKESVEVLKEKDPEKNEDPGSTA